MQRKVKSKMFLFDQSLSAEPEAIAAPLLLDEQPFALEQLDETLPLVPPKAALPESDHYRPIMHSEHKRQSHYSHPYHLFTADADKKTTKPPRSELGLGFHGYLMRYLKRIPNDNEFIVLQVFLEANGSSRTYLTETSINGFSVLADIINISFDKEITADKAQSFKCFERAWNLLVIYMSYDQRFNLAIKTTNKNITLLHLAAKTGHPEVCNVVFNFFKNTLSKHPHQLSNLVLHMSDRGESILKYAVMSRNKETYVKTLELITYSFKCLPDDARSAALQKLMTLFYVDGDAFWHMFNANFKQDLQMYKRLFAFIYVCFVNNPHELTYFTLQETSKKMNILNYIIKSKNIDVVREAIVFFSNIELLTGEYILTPLCSSISLEYNKDHNGEYTNLVSECLVKACKESVVSLIDVATSSLPDNGQNDFPLVPLFSEAFDDGSLDDDANERRKTSQMLGR